MSRVVTLVVLVVLAPLAVTAGAGAVDVGEIGTSKQADGAQANESVNNSTGTNLGASISSFMQSNAERTDQTVRHGMWRAAFERSDGQARTGLAEKRVSELRGDLDEVGERRRALLEARRNGSIDRETFVAQLRSLDARADAITESVRATATALDRAAVTPPGLDGLQESARNVSVAEGPILQGGVGASNGSGPPGGNGSGPAGAAGTGPPGGIETGPPGNGGAENAGTPDPPGGNGPPGTPGENETGPPGVNGTGPPGGNGPPGENGPTANPPGDGTQTVPSVPWNGSS